MEKHHFVSVKRMFGDVSRKPKRVREQALLGMIDMGRILCYI